MTNSSRNILLSALIVAMPALAHAQTPPVKPVGATAAPRPTTVIATPSPTEQFQRQVDRQQLENSQRQNTLREQVRQTNVNTQRTNANDPALRTQLDNADRTQQQLYRARQDDATRRYQADPMKNGTVVPAASGSAGR